MDIPSHVNDGPQGNTNGQDATGHDRKEQKGRACELPNQIPAAAISFASPPPNNPAEKSKKPTTRRTTAVSTWKAKSVSGMPVAQANGKNAAKMASVNQLGMRSDKASPAPAMIMRMGKIEIERKCIINPQDVPAQRESSARTSITWLA